MDFGDSLLLTDTDRQQPNRLTGGSRRSFMLHSSLPPRLRDFPQERSKNRSQNLVSDG